MQNRDVAEDCIRPTDRAPCWVPAVAQRDDSRAMHARKSRSEWSKIIGAFERSGESHEEFCTKRGLNLGSFRGWLYRLRKAAAPEIALVPVTLRKGTSSPSSPFCELGGEIVVAVSEVYVRVVPGTDAVYVAALVAELRARC